jgi:hypothetical protein
VSWAQLDVHRCRSASNCSYLGELGALPTRWLVVPRAGAVPGPGIHLRTSKLARSSERALRIACPLLKESLSRYSTVGGARASRQVLDGRPSSVSSVERQNMLPLGSSCWSYVRFLSIPASALLASDANEPQETSAASAVAEAAIVSHQSMRDLISWSRQLLKRQSSEAMRGSHLCRRRQHSHGCSGVPTSLSDGL